MRDSRIVIFAGHYGSGKTILAVNYALRLSSTYSNVTLCDLDIVNPYFRAADFSQILHENGIQTLASPYANSNVDMPAVPAGMKAVFDNPKLRAVVDLGGDDRGALALGRYAGQILRGGEYEMFLVVNPYRPLTRGLDEIIEVKNEIEAASGVPFTGVVNNPNLGAETTEADVLNSAALVTELTDLTGLPLVFTAVSKKVLQSSGAFAEEKIFPIEIYKKPIWKVDLNGEV